VTAKLGFSRARNPHKQASPAPSRNTLPGSGALSTGLLNVSAKEGSFGLLALSPIQYSPCARLAKDIVPLKAVAAVQG
jgi:hypothetical protein